jgi:hypothetical protein
LKAFFQWMIWNHERTPQQALSLKQYFRRLKQAYTRVTETALDDRIVIDVNAVRFAPKAGQAIIC